MLDLARLEAIRLRRVPYGQVVVGEVMLRWDYLLPRRTRIVLEGVEHLPRDRGVFLAMNHTDRYNYWPLQYQMYRHGGLRFTATWVKGKYYENALLGRFMDTTNNIPLPSRGYLITTDFRRLNGRVPLGDEYRLLRDVVDGSRSEESARVGATPEVARTLDEAGRGEGAFDARFEALFQRMMVEVVRLTRSAVAELDLNVLVFPQGTRSKRLSKGLTGLVQMAQHLQVPIVPVGCNGSDRLYPGASPLSSGGRVVYRFGAPLEPDGPELGPHAAPEGFAPFTHEASARFGASFEAATAVVMDRINALLDEEYRFGDSDESDGVQGTKRFV